MLNRKLMDLLKNLSIPISYMRNLDEEKPPIYAVYYNLGDSGAGYAYDKATATIKTVQINLYAAATVDYSSAQLEIVQALTSAGFIFTDRPESYLETTDTIMKPLEFSLEEENE